MHLITILIFEMSKGVFTPNNKTTLVKVPASIFYMHLMALAVKLTVGQICCHVTDRQTDRQIDSQFCPTLTVTGCTVLWNANNDGKCAIGPACIVCQSSIMSQRKQRKQLNEKEMTF